MRDPDEESLDDYDHEKNWWDAVRVRMMGQSTGNVVVSGETVYGNQIESHHTRGWATHSAPLLVLKLSSWAWLCRPDPLSLQRAGRDCLSAGERKDWVLQ